MNAFEKATIQLAALAVAMSLVAAIFVCLQWLEMRSGGADTHELAIAAVKQANRTKDLADRMKEQAEQTKSVAEQAVVQAQAAKVLAEAAKGQVKKLGALTQATLEQNKALAEQLRISVRPWVGLTDEGEALQTTPLNIDAEGEAQISYSVTAKNFGFAAAQDVYSMAVLVLSEDLRTIQEQWEIACRSSYQEDFHFGYLLFPGKLNQTTRSSSFFPKSQIRLGNNGTVQAWMVGCLAYRDQFGVRYRERFKYWLVNQGGRPVEFIPVPNTVISGTFAFYEGSLK